MTANVNRATSKVDTEDRFIGMMASALDDGGYPGMIVHYKRLAVCLPPGRKFILLIGSLLRDARPPQPRDPSAACTFSVRAAESCSGCRCRGPSLVEACSFLRAL